MIEKISMVSNNNNTYKYKSKNATPIKQEVSTLPSKNFVTPTSSNLQSYVVSFGVKGTDKIYGRLSEIKDNMTPQAETFFDDAKAVAQKYLNIEMTPLHFHYVGLKKLNEYIGKLNSGDINFDNNADYNEVASNYQSDLTDDVFKSKDLRNKILPVINEEIVHLENTFTTLPQTQDAKKIAVSKSFSNDAYNLFDQDNSGEDTFGDGKFSEGYFVNAALGTSDNKINMQFMQPFIYKMQESIMLNDPSKKIAHIALFDEKAKNVLNNIGRGTNMFVTYEDGTNPEYIVSSLENMLNSGEEFGKISSKNSDIVYMNKKATFSYLNDKINVLAKDKTKNHIVVLDIDQMDDLDSSSRNKLLEDKFSEYAPENVKYVILAKKDTYFKETESDNSCFKDYQSVSIPMLNMEQTKKAFKDEPLLMEGIKKEFSPKAINAVIDATAQLEGKYPEKAIKIMKKISAFYIDKEEINAKDVANYINTSKDIFKDTDNNSSIIIKFDTGKRLSDMLGAESTKKDISAIIKQIKNRSIGTKGFVIYPQDGQVGGGRKFSAEVIAGETKSPYIEINANDFGTKEVSIFDLFGGQSVSPETAMKKLFSMVKSQAETSPHKSAVMFIEDFEYFTFGENVSEYHKKAMSQLIREMDIANKQGLNIVVIGSVASGENISQSTQKSYKFIDKVQVESVYGNAKARKEIIEDFVTKNHIKLDAQTPEEKENLLWNMAHTSDGFGFMQLTTLLNKSKNIMSERGHKALKKEDFIEAYLQAVTGARASSGISNKAQKRIVASHECGHALNLHVMHNLAQKQGIPWHLPSKVNFITLDPRGNFGGAMFSKDTENDEISFEKIFSQLVCDYGGNSSEIKLYNQNGSWGITGDLQMATQTAYTASATMGQGKYYGRKSLEGAPYISEKAKMDIEKDVEVFTKNASKVSDMIVENYIGFVEEFTDKYAHKVGTGDCLVTSEEFEAEFNNWIQAQSPAKRAKLEKLDKEILNIIEASKNGRIVK